MSTFFQYIECEKVLKLLTLFLKTPASCNFEDDFGFQIITITLESILY